MAKRFTDTSKWDKQSFADLSLKMKMVWIYLCDKCDHAGVWEINLKLLSFQTGTKVTLREIGDAFGDWIEVHGSKILLTNFLDFQYGNLNPNNRVHASILQRIEKLAPKKDLTSPLQGAKDMEEDMDKELDMDMEEEKNVAIFKLSEPTVEEIYKAYPRKEGKQKGIESAFRQIKSEQDVVDLKLAVSKYNQKIAKDKTEPRFIKMFSTFMNSWREVLDDDYGSTSLPASLNWTETAQKLMAACKRYGFSADSIAPYLDAETVNLARKVGIRKIGEMKDDDFTIKTLASKLKAEFEIQNEVSA